MARKIMIQRIEDGEYHYVKTIWVGDDIEDEESYRKLMAENLDPGEYQILAWGSRPMKGSIVTISQKGIKLSTMPQFHFPWIKIATISVDEKGQVYIAPRHKLKGAFHWKKHDRDGGMTN